jgi:predicted nucleic acid-binding protein
MKPTGALSNIITEMREQVAKDKYRERLNSEAPAMLEALKAVAELSETITTHQNRENHDVLDDTIILDMALEISKQARAVIARVKGE